MELSCMVAQANQEFDHLLDSSRRFFASRKLLKHKYISVQISPKKEKRLWYPATVSQGGASSQGSSHKEAPLGAEVQYQQSSATRGLSAGTTSIARPRTWQFTDPEGWKGPLRYLLCTPDLEQYHLLL